MCLEWATTTSINYLIIFVLNQNLHLNFTLLKINLFQIFNGLILLIIK